MSLEAIVTQFGYPALVVGLLLEGETFLVLGAFLAHRGYLDLTNVIAIAFVVTFLADQFFFWLGRTRGSRFLERHSAWQPNVARVERLLRRNTTLLFLGFRFLYGLRTVTPFVIGMVGFDRLRFALFNVVGALIWAVTFGIAGYAFGQVMEIALEDVSQYERGLAVAIFVAGTGILLYHRWRSKRRRD